MTLPLLVQVEENGMVGEDDGQCAWHSTIVMFGYGIAGIICDVLVDAYSGQRKATVTRDDFGLPSRLVEPLAIALYRACGWGMRASDSDFGIDVCDVESLINRIFYRADAEALLRHIRAVIAAMAQNKQVV